MLKENQHINIRNKSILNKLLYLKKLLTKNHEKNSTLNYNQLVQKFHEKIQKN